MDTFEKACSHRTRLRTFVIVLWRAGLNRMGRLIWDPYIFILSGQIDGEPYAWLVPVGAPLKTRLSHIFEVEERQHTKSHRSSTVQRRWRPSSKSTVQAPADRPPGEDERIGVNYSDDQHEGKRLAHHYQARIHIYGKYFRRCQLPASSCWSPRYMIVC